ncbi:MAG: tannase/feruloyl esterase family alpha/beta hydrolase, partial [Betaproteobacteria bacterium]
MAPRRPRVPGKRQPAVRNQAQGRSRAPLSKDSEPRAAADRREPIALRRARGARITARRLRERPGAARQFGHRAFRPLPSHLPPGTYHYYNSVLQGNYKETQKFYRFFPYPGQGHCGGGTGPAIDAEAL